MWRPAKGAERQVGGHDNDNCCGVWRRGDGEREVGKMGLVMMLVWMEVIVV